MYSAEKLVEKIVAEGLTADIGAVSDCIRELKIDAVYENSDGLLFFDDFAYEKIKESLKAKQEPLQEVSELALLHNQTAQEIENLISEPADELIERQNSEMSTFKLDVTQETLATIAKAMAEKITINMIKYLEEGDIAGLASALGKSQYENQILRAKAKRLQEENKKLRDTLIEKDGELKSFEPFLGGLYKRKKQTGKK